MCTAAVYSAKDHYFGRTLDYTRTYHEEIVITPRRFRLAFRAAASISEHYAILGMAHVADGYPLYYDAINECGLGIAGLNLTRSTQLPPPDQSREQIAVFELIPRILAQCRSVAEARDCLAALSITDLPFSEALPSARLHWMIADAKEAITLELTNSAMQIYDNPIGVLTNEPPFPFQMAHLHTFLHLSPHTPTNTFSPTFDLHACSHGMGAIGLPGDFSSPSRFVRAAFVRANSVSGEGELAVVNQFFHLLGAVEQPRGCCVVADEGFEITHYTSCCNLERGIYYYTTYENHQISAVHLHHVPLDGDCLIRYPLVRGEQILLQN